MPIAFSSIPEYLQISISKKQNAFDFINFQGSSRETYAIGNRVKTRLPLFIEKIWIHRTRQSLEFCWKTREKHPCFCAEVLMDLPIRLVIETLNTEWDPEVTDEFCEMLITFVTATNSSISYFNPLQPPKCSPENFSRLLEKSKIFCFRSLFLKPEFLIKVPAVQKFHELNASSVSDEDLIHLRMPCLCLCESSITSFGVNLILMEWVTGIRKIERIFIEGFKPVRESDLFFGCVNFSVEIETGKTGRLLEKKDKSQVIVCSYSAGLLIASPTPNFFDIWPLCDNEEHFRNG